MSGIFISYRREDTAPWAGRIYERLVQDFPRDHIFMDVDNVAPGLDFMKELERSVGQCDTLISVIGRGWVDTRSAQGNRRLVPSGKGWRDTTIRGHATRRTGILRNDLYAGRLVWNKQTYLRNPETGKRVARVRAAGEHIVAEVPGLRVVDQKLWDAVQARLEVIRSTPQSVGQRKGAFWKQRRPKHLLTGLTYCGECGGHMAAIGKDYLACTAARSGATCDSRKPLADIIAAEA